MEHGAGDSGIDEGLQDGQGPSTSSGSKGRTHASAEKDKTPQQRAGEALLKHILDQVDGECYSFSMALPLLNIFEKRAVKQTAWKCNLEIGTDFKVPVCGYIKVKQSTQKSWKSTYIKGKDQEYSPKPIRSQHLNNDEETEIEKENIVEGHRYGNDIIPITEEDKVNMGYKPPGKVMQVLGFTSQDTIKRHHHLGNSVYCFIADPSDQHASVALSAIIRALDETNCVAIVRRTYSARSNPRLACLIPHIKHKYQCLLYIELPFMEDLRQFTFSSLSTNKKHQPTDEQLDAVNDLITEMDLGNAHVDEDGNKTEELKPKLTFNPYYQRLCQYLMHRALNPTSELPPLSSAIEEYTQQNPSRAEQCSPCVDKIAELFKLEHVKKQEASTADKLYKERDLDGAGPSAKKPCLDESVDVGDLSMAGMAKGIITKVGTLDPVGDFRSIISQKDQDRFIEAADQMQNLIRQLVRESFGAQNYSKSMECLKELRSTSVQLNEPLHFNNFIRAFKDELKDLCKEDFWRDVCSEKVTLITSKESPDSKVSLEEAQKFLEEEIQDEDGVTGQVEEDADDLLDMM